ncbi:hypothetical protein DL98DRAFT_235877 [Cadophora sp. DSE1049]|nr:hypothetical protein DL98DRAFT_235877 [Cadophora sp. DSE1049]
MAGTVSLDSGLLNQLSFALQSGIKLYKTVQSFQTQSHSALSLLEELDDLNGILNSFTEAIGAPTDVELSALRLPLLRCGNACTEFEEEVLKCLSRSGGNLTNFQDWANLRYMGDDIYGFRQLLDRYKSTINIARIDANLHKSSVTAGDLEIYRDLSKNAANNIQTHLQYIDKKLETRMRVALDAEEIRLLKEEQTSSRKSLEICAQFSDHIDQIEPIPEPPEALHEYKSSLNITTAKLESFMKDRIDQLVEKSKTGTVSEEDVTNIQRLQESLGAIYQSARILSGAGTSLKENISTIENYATGDALQLAVSTSGKVIRGKNSGLGWRAWQVGGHMSDVTVQVIVRNALRRGISSVPDDGVYGVNSELVFKERYGPGHKMTAGNTAET